jgi:hypothetical protein
MPLTPVSTQERRQFTRNDPPPRLAINLLQTDRSITATGVNFSGGGLCLRLQEPVEVRSVVRLELAPGRRSVTCLGRVCWVIQRLDLREGPPFLYDVGVEFVDPSPMLRQLLAQQGIRVASPIAKRGIRHRELGPAAIRGRVYLPRLERLSGPIRAGAGPDQLPPWHLVVSVEGVACFSQRYPSERVALAGWARFKRQQARAKR